MIFSFEEDKSIQIQQTWYTFISKNLQITEKLRIFAPDHRQRTSEEGRCDIEGKI